MDGRKIAISPLASPSKSRRTGARFESTGGGGGGGGPAVPRTIANAALLMVATVAPAAFLSVARTTALDEARSGTSHVKFPKSVRFFAIEVVVDPTRSRSTV